VSYRPLRPPIPYFGGKINLGPAIAALLPKHSHYVEPYCGSLSVLLAKAPSDHETVNDLDEKLVNFWRVLRERPAELARACALTPHSRVEYDQAQPLDATDELEAARQVFVKLTQGRSGRLIRTGWRHYVDPAGSNASMPAYLRGYVERIAPAVERLQRVSLECRPALDVIEKYGREPEVLLYVDPPYISARRVPTTTRTGTRSALTMTTSCWPRRCTQPELRWSSPATRRICTTSTCTPAGTDTPSRPTPGKAGRGRAALRCCGRTARWVRSWVCSRLARRRWHERRDGTTCARRSRVSVPASCATPRIRAASRTSSAVAATAVQCTAGNATRQSRQRKRKRDADELDNH